MDKPRSPIIYKYNNYLVYKDPNLFDGSFVVVPTEDKPLKVVFEGNSEEPITVIIEGDSNAPIKKESLEKLIEKVKAASDDDTYRLYLTEERG